MTTQEFLKYQLDDAGYQLAAVFNGLTPEQWNEKLSDDCFSPAETAAHLCDCYSAFLAHADGQEYEWGSLKIDDQSPQNLYKTMMDLRNQCVEKAVNSDDEKVHKHASAYVVIHDPYHIGQMCSLRIKLGNFDPYSIYQQS